MSNLQVRIPRPIFFGVFMSFVALIGVTIIIHAIEGVIPTTAYSKLYHFAAINKFSPAVFSSSGSAELVAEIATFESFVATPLALLAAGATYGLFLRRLDWTQSRSIRAAAVMGAWFSGLIALSDILAYHYLPTITAALAGAPPPSRLPSVTAPVLASAFLQFAAGFIAYALGGWIGVLRRHGLSSGAPASLASEAK